MVVYYEENGSEKGSSFVVVVVYCEEKGSENGSLLVVVVVLPELNIGSEKGSDSGSSGSFKVANGSANGSSCVVGYVSVVVEPLPKSQSFPVRFSCVSKLSEPPKSSCTESVSAHKLDKSVVCVSGVDVSSGESHHGSSGVVSCVDVDEVSVSFEDVIHHSSWLLLTAFTPAIAVILQAA